MTKETSHFEHDPSNQLIRDLVEHIAIGLVICAIDGTFINVNEPFCKLSGYSQAELLKMSFRTITHPDDLSSDLALVQQTMDGTLESFTIEKRYLRKDRSIIWVNLTVSLIRDKNNAPQLFFGTIEDISLRKKAQFELQESETRYRSLLDMAPVGIAVHCDEKIVFANQTAYRLFGAETPEELIDKTIPEIVHPSNLSSSLDRFKRVMTGEKGLYPAEDKYLCLDGTAKDVQVYATAIHFRGKPSVQLIVMDITESKKIREHMLEWERRFSNIMKSVKLVSITLDNHATITFCNQYLLDLTGYTLSEVIGRNWFELFIPSEFNDEVQSVFTEAVKNDHVITNYENDIRTRDGKRISISWNNTLLKDIQGEVIGIASIGDNITEQKKAVEELKISEEKFSRLFHSSPDAILLERLSDGVLTEVNDSAFAITGYTKEELIGQSTLNLNFWHNPDERNIFNELLKKNHRVTNLEAEFRMKSGEVKTGLVSGETIQLHDGLYIMGIIRDISLQKKAQQEILEKNKEFAMLNEELTESLERIQMINSELSKAKLKAEESDRLKTAFLQNMSHEIRTPLNSIMGFSELLPHTYEDKATLSKYTSIIKQRGNDLLEIINDVLDVAAIESGQMTVNVSKCRLNHLFSDIEVLVSEYRARMEMEHIGFKLNVPCIKEDELFVTDSGKLKKIVMNLITNAFKFTPAGTVEVGCKLEGNNQLSFYVRDTGIGIPLEKQSEIFERFIQINVGKTKRYGGTGLGLPITKGLLNLLGGNIWLESEPTKGSTFYFTIPYHVYGT